MAPKSHAASTNAYGQGSASNFGHLKVSDNYTSSAGAANAGVAASSKAVNDLYKLLTGNVVILGIQSITLSDSQYVDNGAVWTATGTFTLISGASNYMIIPVTCNFGFISKITRSGANITATATNASGSSHSCSISACVIAYK